MYKHFSYNPGLVFFILNFSAIGWQIGVCVGSNINNALLWENTGCFTTYIQSLGMCSAGCLKQQKNSTNLFAILTLLLIDVLS
jgi:hypothetical protein